MPTLSTTDVSKRLQFTITSSLITALGIKPVETKMGKPRWADSDYPVICEKLARHIKGTAQQHAARSLDDDGDEL